MVYTNIRDTQNKSDPKVKKLSNSAKSAEAPPLFRQIVNDLKGRIIDGELQEHMALPSERTVAEQHNVSRMTARRALEAVEAEGLAYSQDRKGRFVSPKRLDYDVGSMANFISGAVAKGIEIEMKLLDSKQSTAPEKLAHALSVPAGHACLPEHPDVFARWSCDVS